MVKEDDLVDILRRIDDVMYEIRNIMLQILNIYYLEQVKKHHKREVITDAGNT